MKKLIPFLFVASLAANATFAFYLVRGGSLADASASAPAPPTSASVAPAAAGPRPVAEIVPGLADKSGKNLSAIIADLRAAGFPPDVVRAIASALLDEEFAARRKALDPEDEKRAYWKEHAPDPKFYAQQMQLWSEQARALRALLGPEADANDPTAQARKQQRFGFLPPDKMALAEEIVRGFDEQRSAVYAGRVYTQAERDKAADLTRQEHAALAQLLTPAELLEYDLRASDTARQMRDNLSAFQPTEDEFRAIFKLRQPFDEQWKQFYDTGLPSQEEMNRRNVAEKQLNELIKAQLGAIRGPEYELTTNYDYRRTSQLVARLELPPEATKQIWDAQKEFQQRAGDIRRSTNGQERITQLTALQQDATQKLTTLLGGADGVEAYKQYGGNWLQNLVPRSPPKK